MSRVDSKNKTFNCIGCDETDFHLSSTTWNSNFGSSSYPYNNLKDGSSSSNYARITIDKTQNAESYLYLMFDFSEIPNTANITRTNGKVRLYSSGTSTYCSARRIRWCINDIDTPLRTSENYSTSSNPVAIEVTPLQTVITPQELKNVKCYVNYLRRNRNTGNNLYIYIYGADVTVDWEETYYSISTSSNVQGVSISSTSGETLEGGSNTITLLNVSDISTIKVMDNGNDITSSFTRSGSNYVYTLTNINADHTIVVEDASSSSKKSYVKKNNTFVETANQYVKESNSWINRTISNIFWKINGSWTETNDSMSGKTAFKIDV